VGNLQDRIDRDGRKIHCDYDKANRPTDEKWYDTDLTTLVRTISYTYDNAGRLYQATDPDSTYGYTYDSLGQVTYESQSYAGFSPLIEYDSTLDGAGKLTHLAATIAGTADFENTFSYDTLARVSSIIQQNQTGGNAVAEKRADFSYDDSGAFTQISRYADAAGTELALNTFYAYDDAGRLTQLTHTMDTSAPSSGWGTNPLAGYQFTYDAASRITAINSYIDGNTDYTYDDTDQLTSADHPSSGPADESYSYDENGNRTMTGYSTGTNNQLSSDGTYNYTYDDEGNRLTKTNISTGDKEEYTWDWRNRLTNVTFKDSNDNVVNTVDYAYDFLNQLIRRTLDDDGAGPNAATDEFFSNQGGQITLQFGGSTASNLSHRFVWNPAAIDQLLADETVTSLSTAGTVLYPLADHLGTVQDLASHNSSTHATSIDNHRTYDTYGNVASETNSAVDEIFGFTGRLLDDATGEQWNLNRWYDPQTGRWTSEDPVSFFGDPSNLYRYGNDNPVSATDPDGMAPEWVTWAMNPIDALRIWWWIRDRAAELARRLASDLGCAGISHNGPEDALRHALWNALMAQYLGPDEAKKFADAHERPGGNADERAMDLWNNVVGRSIGAANRNADEGTIVSLVAQAYLGGQLRVLRQSGSGPVPPGTPLLPSGGGCAALPLPADPGVYGSNAPGSPYPGPTPGSPPPTRNLFFP
jgi:RHS repeat-associated protein